MVIYESATHFESESHFVVHPCEGLEPSQGSGILQNCKQERIKFPDRIDMNFFVG